MLGHVVSSLWWHAARALTWSLHLGWVSYLERALAHVFSVLTDSLHDDGGPAGGLLVTSVEGGGGREYRPSSSSSREYCWWWGRDIVSKLFDNIVLCSVQLSERSLCCWWQICLYEVWVYSSQPNCLDITWFLSNQRITSLNIIITSSMLISCVIWTFFDSSEIHRFSMLKSLLHHFTQIFYGSVFLISSNILDSNCETITYWGCRSLIIFSHITTSAITYKIVNY